MNKFNHINKKWAFADGLLTGLTLAFFASRFYKDHTDILHRKDIIAAEMKAHSEGFHGGWTEGRLSVRPYINHDHFERVNGTPFQ